MNSCVLVSLETGLSGAFVSLTGADVAQGQRSSPEQQQEVFASETQGEDAIDANED